MKKNKLYWQPVLIFLITGIIASIFARFGVDPHHDGIMLKPALDVSLGKVLFKDTFTQYGALTTWIQAWGIYFFGEYLLVIKLMTAFFYASSSVLLWFIWREFIPDGLATLGCLILLILSPYLLDVSLPWSSVIALFFQLLSTLFLISYIRSLRIAYLVTAGCLAGIVFWCRQPVGVFHFVALLLFLSVWSLIRKSNVKNWLKELSGVSIGFFAVDIFYLVWIAAHGALPDWWKQSIKFSFAFGESFGKGFSLQRLFSVFFPFPLDINNGGYIWDVFPIAGLIVFAQKIYKAFVRKVFSTDDGIVLAIVLVALGSWHQYYPFPCFRHSFWAASPLVGILIYLIWSSFSSIKKTNVQIFLSIAVLTIIFVVDYSDRIPKIVNYYNVARVELTEPKILRGMMIDPVPAKMYSEIAEHLSAYLVTHPEAVVINATSDALYMTFSEHMRNFHPAYVKWSLLQHVIYLDYQKSLLNYVAKMRPLIFIYIPPDLKQSSENVLKNNIFNGEELFEKYAVMFKAPDGLTLIQPIE
ncbi:MAG: glycosyltransferase family 39 protein [Pseudobdellovibrio sp.]